jgi:hypothetical protein
VTGQRWLLQTDSGAQVVAFTEDRPGQVMVATDLLLRLFSLAGMTPMDEGGPVDAAVAGQVTRDTHGRCTECGTTPAQNHRPDCRHFGAAPYETRPTLQPGEERR